MWGSVGCGSLHTMGLRAHVPEAGRPEQDSCLQRWCQAAREVSVCWPCASCVSAEVLMKGTEH